MQIKSILQNGLFKDTLIYGLTNALYTGLPLLLLPFLIVTLSPEDYGLVDLFRSISMVLVPILGLSTVQSIGRFYFDLDEQTFKKFVSSIQIFIIGTSLCALIFIQIASLWISFHYQILLILCVLNFLFGQFRESLLVIYRVNNKPKSFLIIRVVNVLLELFILFILFKTLNQLDWRFRVYPIVIGSLITALLTFYHFRRLGFNFNFSKALLYKSLFYSTPLILHMLSGYVLNIGDRFLIKLYLTDKDLGNYAVAYQIGMTVNFFYTSFNLAWTPTYFKWMKEGKISAINKVRKYVYIITPTMGIFVLVIWLSLRSLLLNNSEYNISNKIVIVILIANIILSLYKFESNYFLFTKNTRKLSLFTLISAVISIVLNMLFIPSIGIFGSAVATLISFIVMYILVNLKSNRNEKKD